MMRLDQTTALQLQRGDPPLMLALNRPRGIRHVRIASRAAALFFGAGVIAPAPYQAPAFASTATGHVLRKRAATAAFRTAGI